MARNPEARRLPWGLVVLIAALGARALYLWEISGTEIFPLLWGDGEAYHEWGVRIAGGDWLGREVFFQAPLYPYFLGLVYAVAGPSTAVVRCVQAILGAIACWLLYRAGRRFFSVETAAVAGLLLALYPPAVFFDGLIQKSALDLLFTTAVLCGLARIVCTERSRADFVLTGAAVGALALTRENALVLLPTLLAWIGWHFRAVAWRQRFVWGACLTAGVLVLLMPVGIRNRVVGGEFALTTSQLGPNLYIGNNPRATGRYVPLQAGHGNAADERLEATAIAERAVGHALTPREVSRYWTGRALEWMSSDPGAWARLMGKKWMLFWNAAEVADTDDQETYAEYSRLLAVLGPIYHFAILATLGAVGLWLTIGDRRRLGVLYLLAATLAVSTTAFFVVARYRLPLVPILALFAGAGVVQAFAGVRARDWPRLAVAAVVAVASGVVCGWPMITPGSQRAPTHYNLGLAKAQQGDVAGARRFFEEAVQIDPNLSVAWGNLGTAYAMQGDLGNAERCFREALARDPGLADVHANLATILWSDGRQDEAVAHYQEAVRLRPWGPGLRTKLGLALVDMGRPSEAGPHLEAAVDADPSDPLAYYGLGLALAATGRSVPALEQLAHARELAVAAHNDALVRDIDERMAALRGARPDSPPR